MFIISQTSDMDANTYDSLLTRAFGPGRLTRTAERLREGNKPIDALTHIAKDAGALVGAIHFWPITIGDTPALLLGPLAVAPDYQGKGIGLALMQESLAVLDSKPDGIAGVLLVGDAPYYARVGFAPIPAGRVQMPGPVDLARLLFRLQSPDLELPKGRAYRV